jgi:hypothetical protein
MRLINLDRKLSRKEIIAAIAVLGGVVILGTGLHRDFGKFIVRRYEAFEQKRADKEFKQYLIDNNMADFFKSGWPPEQKSVYRRYQITIDASKYPPAPIIVDKEEDGVDYDNSDVLQGQ